MCKNIMKTNYPTGYKVPIRSDLLPLLGILVGWGLAEGSAFGKRSIERRRVIGRALSLLYFLFNEMVQVKQAQEYAKNQTQDVQEWERTRQRAFAQYTVSSDEHSQKLTKTADELGPRWPGKFPHLRPGQIPPPLSA